MENLVTKPDVSNAQDVVEHQIQMEGQNENALFPQATSNPGAMARPTTQFFPEQNMESGVEIAEKELDLTQQGEVMEKHQSMTKDDKIWKKGVKFALWATTLAGTSVIALAAVFLAFENTIPHDKRFLLAFLLITMCASFICGVLMLVHWTLCPSSPKVTVVVMILILGSIASTTFGVLFGTVFSIQKMF